jgi:spore germination protein KB
MEEVMENLIITRKQTTAIVMTFLLGSSLVLGTGGKAGRDAWLAVPVALFMVIPMYMIYSRILSLFPGMCLIEIIISLFGRIFGLLFILLYNWYAFHLGSLVIRNFSEFVKIVGLRKTPQFITSVCLILLCIWAVKAGIETIARWTALVLPLMLFVILIVTLLMIPKYDINNIRPILYEGIKPVLDASFSVFAFPFAESVICMVLFRYVKEGTSPYKVFLWSGVVSASVLFVTTIRSILVLGADNVRLNFFASYVSVRLLKIGEFIERIEVSVAIIFMLGGFVKICICMLAACRGISNLLKTDDHRKFAAPLGFMMAIFSITVYSSTYEMFDWADNIYKFFAIPFEIIMPLIIWIAAEIKARARKKTA